MHCALKPLLCSKVEILKKVIEKSEKNWQFYMYYSDDHSVYNELHKQLELEHKDKIRSIYSGCNLIHDGIHCDGAHGDAFTLEFSNRSGTEYIDLQGLLKGTLSKMCLDETNKNLLKMMNELKQ